MTVVSPCNYKWQWRMCIIAYRRGVARECSLQSKNYLQSGLADVRLERVELARDMLQYLIVDTSATLVYWLDLSRRL